MAETGQEAPKRFYGMVAVEAPCKEDGQREIERGALGYGAQEGAFFAFGLKPGGIGSGGDGADAVSVVSPVRKEARRALAAAKERTFS